MIKFVSTDIFQCEVEAYVNPVNCVGVMGKGLALKFKEKFPDNYAEYKKICDYKNFNIGDVLITSTHLDIPKYIINFPTKNDWKEPSKIEYIEKGLKSLFECIYNANIKSIAIPALGCGLGGLNWKDVRPLILLYEKRLNILNATVYVIESKQNSGGLN